MPIYRYVALTETGTVVKNAITAADKHQALAELQELGLFVQNISPEISFGFGFGLGRGRINAKELQRLIKSLRSLLQSGMPLAECLLTIADDPENPNVGFYVQGIAQSVQSGKSLSQACQAYPEIFDRLFVSMMETGEKSGDLPAALMNYQDYLQQKIQLQRKIKSALAYPVFLLGSLAIVLAILFVYVIPNFSELFTSFDAELPAITQMILNLAHYAPVSLVLLLVVSVAGVLAHRLFRVHAAWLQYWDHCFLRLPFIGMLRQRAQVARLADTLAHLLASGSTVTDAMALCAQTLYGTQLGEKLSRCQQNIIEGASIYQAFEQHQVLSGYALKMLAVGEKSASLERVLKDIAQYQKEELDDSMERVTSLLEPALILLMGVVMGFVIIAMYLPIFYMSEVVK